MMLRPALLFGFCLGCAHDAPTATQHEPCGIGAKNVRDPAYGAVGDGRTDDTDAFRLAIDDAGTLGSVCVPKGMYLISAGGRNGPIGLELPGNFTLEMSAGATLKAAPSHGSHSLLRILNVQNVTVRGGTLVESDTPPDIPAGTVAEGLGIDIRGADNVTLEGVVVRGFSTDGIRIDGFSAGGETRNSSEVTLLDCASEANHRHGLAIVGCIDALVQGGRFTANREDPSSAGIALSPRPDLRVENVRVVGALLANNRHGLLAQLDPGVGSARLRSSVVSASATLGNSETGFLLSGVREPVILDGNQVFDNAGSGIRMVLTSSALVAHNQVDGSGEVGIRIECSWDNLIDGNRVSGSSGKGTGLFDQILVESPKSCAEANGQWQEQFYSHDNDINGQQVRLGAQRNARYGLRIDSLQCVDNRVGSNDLKDSGTVENYSDAGKGTVEHDNRTM